MRFRFALIALVLIAAGCGDDDGGAVTTAPGTTAAATTSQAPTTATPTTTAAPTTTTEAVTTTADPFAEIAALVADYEGGYEGTWNNTTFGSEGPIVGNLEFDPDSLTLTLDLDLGVRPRSLRRRLAR